MANDQEKSGCLSVLLGLLGRRQPSASTGLPLSPDKATAPRVQPLTSTAEPAYRKSDSIFTYRERVFYGALLDAVGGDYWTFAKVRLADFIWLPKDTPDHQFHNNAILCKHVDYLVCARQTFKPLLAIELDDPSHRYPDSQKRDDFKNRAFATAGLPVMRVTMAQDYSVEELVEQIKVKIHEAAQQTETQLNSV